MLFHPKSRIRESRTAGSVLALFCVPQETRSGCGRGASIFWALLRLELRKNRSLYSRIERRLAIGPMMADDTGEHVRLRLRRARADREFFTADTLDKVRVAFHWIRYVAQCDGFMVQKRRLDKVMI